MSLGKGFLQVTFPYRMMICSIVVEHETSWLFSLHSLGESIICRKANKQLLLSTALTVQQDTIYK